MAQALGPAVVRYGTRVRRVVQSAGGVRVETAGGAVLHARYIVATGAPSVVGRLEFDPPLPEQKRRLAERVPMGNAVRMSVVYPEPFWRAMGLSGSHGDEGAGVLLPLGYDASPCNNAGSDSDPPSCRGVPGVIQVRCVERRGRGSVKHPGHQAGVHATRVNHEAHATRNQQGTRPARARPMEWGSECGGRPGQRVEEQGTWASHTQKHSDADRGRPEDGGVGTAKTVKRPPEQPAQPPIRQLLGAADAQTAHAATSSTAPAHQPLGSANAETTPAGAPAAAAIRPQRPDATCEGTNG